MRAGCGIILGILMAKLKICGLKNLEQVGQIAALNVDFLGLIFAESPRQVREDEAGNLAGLIHKNHKKAVGVFVEEGLEQILSLARNVGLDGVQIYRRITPREFEALRAAGLFVWQALSVGERLDWGDEIHADLVLLDAKGEFKGGNGVRFDWALLEGLRGDFILAGGIGVHNVKEALATGAAIIDVNSGVESAAGVKDVAKIKALIKEMGR